MTRPEIGVYLPQMGFTYSDILHRALRCEELGIDSLWLYDHLYGPGAPDYPSLEAWTLATALLSSTERIQVGHMVLCNQCLSVRAGRIARMSDDAEQPPNLKSAKKEMGDRSEVIPVPSSSVRDGRPCGPAGRSSAEGLTEWLDGVRVSMRSPRRCRSANASGGPPGSHPIPGRATRTPNRRLRIPGSGRMNGRTSGRG